MAGLCREAVDRALADAALELAEIDAIVVGKAPDLFEGVMMPELYLADALGAAGKPLLRVHTAGSVGGATGVVAASLVQAGLHRRVLAVAFEKQSESNAMWALSISPPFSMPLLAGAGGYFAPHVRSYIRRSGAPTHIGALVAVKDRRNGARNPYAHLRQPDITLDSVQASPMLWDPVRYDETCPSSDGACAVVIGDQAAAEASARPVAWIRATSMRTEPTMFSGKDNVNPRAGADAAAALWAAAGISRPIEEIDVAEIYVPFSWFEPMWLENLGFAAAGEGWKLTEAGETEIGGSSRSTPLAGCSAPIRSGRLGCSGSPNRRCRSWARQASIRWPGHGRRSGTPMAGARSTSPCGWSPTPRISIRNKGTISMVYICNEPEYQERGSRGASAKPGPGNGREPYWRDHGRPARATRPGTRSRGRAGSPARFWAAGDRCGCGTSVEA